MNTEIFEFWKEIESSETVHSADKGVLNRVEHNFDLRCLPGAYFGPLWFAPVVLLYLSPGWCQRDVDEASTPEAQQRYVKQRQGRSLLWSPEEHLEGWRWWSSRTAVFGEWKSLRDKIAVLNVGGYHSKSFERYELLASLPSCRASLNWAQTVLFSQAIEGERIVICLRAHRFWGLSNNKRFGKSLYVPNVVRGGHMTHGALRNEIIEKVKEHLSH